MKINFYGSILVVDNHNIPLAWNILNAIEYGERIVVLLDPDSYILDPQYKENRRQGMLPIKNLISINKYGDLLWEADFPNEVDYYYRVISFSPFLVNSFSSYRCEIDLNDGHIVKMDFFK